MDCATEMTTYFAYGTLLDLEAMRRNCPTAQPSGIHTLTGYRLGFATCAKDTAHGGCTLDEDPKGVIYGLLYRLPKAEADALDRAAGVDIGLWDEVIVTLRDGAGSRSEARTYTIDNAAGPWPPPDSYVAPIRSGARALKLPDHYIALLEDIIAAARNGG